MTIISRWISYWNVDGRYDASLISIKISTVQLISIKARSERYDNYKLDCASTARQRGQRKEEDE